MAHRRSKKQSQRSRQQKLRRSVGRMLGFGGATSALITFSLGSVLNAPPARADGLDVILDPIINSLSSVDPSLAVDMTGWLANLDSALNGASSFDPTSLASAATTAESSSLGALSTDVGSASAANPFDTFVQGLEQQWIDSPLGQQMDSSLNAWFNQVDPAAANPAADPADNSPVAGACGLICNGVDGTAADPTGQGGGLLFGKGGTGFDENGAGGTPAAAGGAGGDAGFWGNGGAGGDGGDATTSGGDGGAGGAGGNGGSFFGSGGEGGTGGNGADGAAPGGDGGSGGNGGIGGNANIGNAGSAGVGGNGGDGADGLNSTVDNEPGGAAGKGGGGGKRGARGGHTTGRRARAG